MTTSPTSSPTQVHSLRLADQLGAVLDQLQTCPELAATVAIRRATLTAHAAPMVTADDVATLWATANLNRLTIGTGEQDREYRAHAICALIRDHSAAIAAHRLSKIWIMPGRQFGPYGWFHHVAPVVATAQGDLVLDPLVPVLDPSLPAGPYDVAVWLAACQATQLPPPRTECWESRGKPLDVDDLAAKVTEWIVLQGERSAIDAAKQLRAPG